MGAGGPNNAQSCGALLVTFHDTVADDFVLVGTGEALPGVGAVSGQWGGLGVLVGKGAAGKPPGDNPWETESGLAQLAGLGVFRLVRDPTSTRGVHQRRGHRPGAGGDQRRPVPRHPPDRAGPVHLGQAARHRHA